MVQPKPQTGATGSGVEAVPQTPYEMVRVAEIKSRASTVSNKTNPARELFRAILRETFSDIDPIPLSEWQERYRRTAANRSSHCRGTDQERAELKRLCLKYGLAAPSHFSTLVLRSFSKPISKAIWCWPLDLKRNGNGDHRPGKKAGTG